MVRCHIYSKLGAILLLFICAIPAHCNDLNGLKAADPLVFHPSGDEIQSVVPFAYELEDATSNLTLADVLSERAGPFRPASEKTYFGYANTIVWLKLTIDFAKYPEQQFYFYKEFQHYGKLTVYFPTQDGYKSEVNDWSQPYAGRRIAARPILFKLPRPTLGIATYYIKYEPRGNLLKVALLWGSDKAVLEDVSSIQTAQWMVLGGLTALWAYNLFLLCILRDRPYFFYTYYLFCLTIVLADISGQLSLIVPNAENYLHLYALFALGAQHGVVRFTKSFFQTCSNTPRLHRLLTVCEYFLAVAALYTLVIGPARGYAIAPVLALFVAIGVISASFIRWRQGFLPARYCLLGWGMFGYTLSVYCLETLGVLPAARFDPRGMMYGALWEATLFSFALAYRVRISDTALRQEHSSKKKALEEATAANASALRALDESNQATKDKNLFFSMVSHELKSPIQSIITVLAIEDKRSGGHERRDSLKKIRWAVKYMEAQIRDLFVLSVGEAGKLEMRSETFEVGELVDEVVLNVSGIAAVKGLEVIVRREVEFLFVATDPKRVEQVLLNLVENAVKYTEHGQITIQFRIEKPATLCIVVADTGIGIATDNIDKLFVPYRRFGLVDRDHNSLGIGLSVVQTLLKHLGGQCSVESTLGAGSTFTVRVPVAVVDELVPDCTPRDGIRLLIVDDRPEMLADLKQVAELLGYHADVACSAPLASNQLAVSAYDLVLIDLDMPIKNGAEMASEIRRSRGPNSESYLVAVSAGNGESQGIHADGGLWPFDAFEQKPIDARAMKRIVETRARYSAAGPQA